MRALTGLLTLSSFLVVGPAHALERLHRSFGLEHGLPSSEVFGLAQDTRGFVWIATAAGLFRYDGVEMRAWPASGFRPLVTATAAGPHGEVVTRDYEGRFLEVHGDDLQPVPGPAGPEAIALACPAFDGRGDLWGTGGGRLWRRAGTGTWSAFPAERLAGEEPRCTVPASDGALLLLTTGGLWRIGPGEEAKRLVARPHIQAALASRDGTITVLLADGHVWRYANGEGHEVFRLGLRPIDVVQRGAAIWVSYDRALVILEPGREPETLGAAQGVPSGGPLLVDREGSLWVGTFRGLLQFPSPETVAWSDDDGLSAGTRRLARTNEGIWIDTWQGLFLLPQPAGTGKPQRIEGSSTSAICTGADGTLWAAAPGHVLVRRAGRFLAVPIPGLTETFSCAPGREDRVWLTTNTGLFLARASGSASRPSIDPRPLPPEVNLSDRRPRAMEDSAGRVWLTAGEQICETDARRLASEGRVDWSCSRASGAGEILGAIEGPAGDPWAATLQLGVIRPRPGAGWEPVPGARLLPGRTVRALRHSPSGGVWIVSYGTLLRIVARPDASAGWDVVERPSPWHGLMIGDAEDILEEPDGDLWITTLAGLVHVPASIRRSEPTVPPVELIDVLVDGQARGPDVPLRLPYDRNRIELRFAGLSYRDPGLLQYQARLGPDRPWMESSARPSFRFVDLPPGRYHAEVRASLDGRRWSSATAGMSFTVLPPFWRTWWFLLLVVASAVSAAWALVRYRLAQLLRLERMRTRIAADLHDDIGSSLSRIAIQSDLVRRPAALPPREVERLLLDIGESARSLVDSMSDIVWSIDPKRDDLGSLAARLRQFALGILEPLDVAFELSVPENPASVRLAPERRRHLYLILKEAIHNVAKHAACRRLGIRIRLDGWRLHVEITDDGRGFAEPSRDGHGLRSMRSRAALLGGSLEISSVPGSGTMLELICPIGPTTHDRALPRRTGSR